MIAKQELPDIPSSVIDDRLMDNLGSDLVYSMSTAQIKEDFFHTNLKTKKQPTQVTDIRNSVEISDNSGLKRITEVQDEN